MGVILQAKCRCGYQSETFMHGVGFRFWETGAFYEAVYCDHCGIVYGRDGRSVKPRCKKCRKGVTYYQTNEPDKEDMTLFGLPNTADLDDQPIYHCPSCRQNTLCFESTGLWD